jgi:hypothetical protein
MKRFRESYGARNAIDYGKAESLAPCHIAYPVHI